MNAGQDGFRDTGPKHQDGLFRPMGISEAGPDCPLYVSPETMSFQAMRAILLASATAASLGGFRLSSSANHREALPDRRA